MVSCNLGHVLTAAAAS